jgi:peptidoglycan/xylan/chitin deacetylase (PgdA/CDA1 family)
MTLKYSLLCFILFSSFFLQTALAGQVNTFIYHRFDEDRYPSTNISAEIFKQQLDYIQEHDITVLGLPEIVARLRSGEALPDQAVALCVDDAYRSFYDVAMPLLRKYQFPVTLFVNTDAVGSNGYLNWSELQELVAQGVEIGNHTASHAYLVEMRAGESVEQWRQRVRADITRAQQALQQNLGIEATLFAYPYGEYSDKVVALVEKMGFAAAFAQQSGVMHSGHNLYTLPRFPMGGPFASFSGFVNKLEMEPLIVTEVKPFDPVIRTNPPQLQLTLREVSAPAAVINCFVQGDNRCWVEKLSEQGPGNYLVRAEQPLQGRRNKYTLTFQGQDGAWQWYSHPWINAEQPVSASSDQ